MYYNKKTELLRLSSPHIMFRIIEKYIRVMVVNIAICKNVSIIVRFLLHGLFCLQIFTYNKTVKCLLSCKTFTAMNYGSVSKQLKFSVV